MQNVFLTETNKMRVLTDSESALLSLKFDFLFSLKRAKKFQRAAKSPVKDHLHGRQSRPFAGGRGRRAGSGTEEDRATVSLWQHMLIPSARGVSKPPN